MDNKHKILESALKLFCTKGYDASGVQEIADKAGITKPTLYHYFGSKYGLLECLVSVYYGQFYEHLQKAAVYEGDLPLTLYRFVRAYFEIACGNEAFYRFFMSMMYAGRDSDMYKAVSPYAKEMLGLLTGLFLKAGDIIGNMNGRQEQYAITFIGVLNHYLLLKMNKADPISDEQAFAVVHQFLHGIYV